MNTRDYISEWLPRALSYKLSKLGLAERVKPFVLTFSVTAACQSRCKTCKIGDRYHANRGISYEDLSLEEIEKIFRSMGEIYFLNISGEIGVFGCAQLSRSVDPEGSNFTTKNPR